MKNLMHNLVTVYDFEYDSKSKDKFAFWFFNVNLNDEQFKNVSRKMLIELLNEYYKDKGIILTNLNYNLTPVQVNFDETCSGVDEWHDTFYTQWEKDNYKLNEV